jgi:hypothetical protein
VRDSQPLSLHAQRQAKQESDWLFALVQSLREPTINSQPVPLTPAQQQADSDARLAYDTMMEVPVS